MTKVQEEDLEEEGDEIEEVDEDDDDDDCDEDAPPAKKKRKVQPETTQKKVLSAKMCANLAKELDKLSQLQQVQTTRIALLPQGNYFILETKSVKGNEKFNQGKVVIAYVKSEVSSQIHRIYLPNIYHCLASQTKYVGELTKPVKISITPSGQTALIKVLNQPKETKK